MTSGPRARSQRARAQAGRPAMGAAVVAGAVTVALLWALCYPLVTTAVQYAPPLRLGSLRALLAGVVLVVAAIILRRPQPRRAQWLAVAAIGITSTGLGFTGMFLAGGRVSPGIATVLANTQPLLAALLGYFALGESLKGWQGVGMVTAFAGIAVVAVPTFAPSGATSVSIAGIAFVLLGAVGVSVGNVLMKRFAAALDPIAATGWQLLFGSVVLFGAAAVWDPSGGVQWSGPFALALAGLVVPGSAVAFVLWFALIGRAPLNSLNVFSFLTPIFGLGIAAAFYGERLGGLEIAGAGLVIGGAWLAARRKREAISLAEAELARGAA